MRRDAVESVFSAKAKENLRAAEMLFTDRMYNASANRAYYATFHAAVAALSSAGIQLDRIKHETVQAKFNGELIRRKKSTLGASSRICLSYKQ